MTSRKTFAVQIGLLIFAVALSVFTAVKFWFPLFRIVDKEAIKEQSQGAISTSESIKTIPHSELDAKIESLINTERKKLGVKPLLHDDCLDSAAQNRAKEIVESGKFSHTRPNGKRFAEGDYLWCDPAYNRGENLAIDFTSVEAVVEAWLASKSHHDLMLSPDFTHFGTGSYQTVVTLEMAKYPSSYYIHP